MAPRVRRLACIAPLALLIAGPSPTEAAAWRVTGGEVRVTVPVVPGGSFEAWSEALEGDLTLGDGKPAPVTGELRMNLKTLGTGIELRDRHLQERLEVSKGEGFDVAVLSEVELLDVEGDGFEGRTRFVGTLLMHGIRKQIAGHAKLGRAGGAVRVAATFVLALTDFGVTPPMYMGVGVADRLIVEVRCVAELVAEEARRP